MNIVPRPRAGARCPCALTALAAAMAVTSPAHALDEMTVTASRVPHDSLSLPLSVSTIESDAVQERQMAGLDEALLRVPGVFASDRYNYSRDLRLSIRGFGARSNFGIRGIKVFVDGMPSTVSDGQTSLDDLDLSNVSKIEVLRGPASALYGSSAGGVINIETENGTKTPFVSAGASYGDWDFQRYQLKAGGEIDRLNYFVNGSYLDYDGYRDHSETRQGIVNGKFAYTFDDGSVGTLIMRGAAAPQADDPGGLNRAELAAGRRNARDRNVTLDAGEEVHEERVGLSWHKQDGVHEFTLRNYYNWRDFDALLPLTPGAGSGAVTFHRFFYGGGGQYSNSAQVFGHDNRVTVGFEVDTMTDDRKRFNNVLGQRGALRFDEDENGDTAGVYLQEEFKLTSALMLQAGLRYDHVRLALDDRFLTNGDQSGTLSFNEVNPMFGAVYSFNPAVNVYANYATAFETPTFTEFSGSDDTTSFTQFDNAAAQRSRGFEVGVKGLVATRVRYELAFYRTLVDDEVSTTTNVGGRAFFNNADTERQGVELGITAELLPRLILTTTYTYSDLSFRRFNAVPGADDQALPGMPQHLAYAELAYHHETGWFARWDIQHAGSMYADNVNTVKVGSYNVSNLVFGKSFRYGNSTITPSFGVNNLFDERYFQDIRIEDSTRRYFEPAPPLNVFGAIKIRFDVGG